MAQAFKHPRSPIQRSRPSYATTALSYATVTHAVGFVGVTLIGLYYFLHDHIRVSESLNNRAGALEAQSKSDMAEPRFEEALEMNRRMFPGKDHPQTMSTLHNLALARQRLGRPPAEIEPLYRESLEMQRRLHPQGTPHPQSALVLHHLADLLRQTGRVEEGSGRAGTGSPEGA